MWDMPTGILRDIWIALSSLGDYQSPKLEKLWVRLHDNRAALSEVESAQTSTAPQPAQAVPSQAPALAPALYQTLDFGGVPRLVLAKNNREEPNFSIMSPLRSLTVLDIDEMAYLDEMSVLLERSLDKLRELRIGFAPILYSSSNNREQAPLKYVIKGGPLPLLMSKIYDYLGNLHEMEIKPKHDNENAESIERPDDEKKEDADSPSPTPTASILGPNISAADITSNSLSGTNHETLSGMPEIKVPGMSLNAIDPALFEGGLSHEDREMPGSQTELGGSALETSQDPIEQLDTTLNASNDPKSLARVGLQQTGTACSTAWRNALKPTRRLKLETLEIEKITLHVITLYKTIDWTILTTLTLLNCEGTETLWSCLQEKFPPRKTLVVSKDMQSTRKRGSQPCLRRMPSSEASSKTSEYPLRLKRIHTNHVSSTLISFLKHALAPDSLEWLFLQDTSTHDSSVTLDAIYRGPLRRHRSSLAKVMIDSSRGPGISNQRTRDVNAKKWMLSREVLTFISSGRMGRLRELAMTIQYKDWHFFLQRLPQIPHLRSLYIPCIIDHPYGNSLKEKDFAMSAIDVVALRPEVELCYLGIKQKCFEILETKDGKRSKDGSGPASANAGGGDSDDDDDAEVHHDHDDDNSSEDEDPGPLTPATQAQEMDSDLDSITDDDEPDPVGGNKIKLKLREILFYEDRISIFKARHGRL